MMTIAIAAIAVGIVSYSLTMFRRVYKDRDLLQRCIVYGSIGHYFSHVGNRRLFYARFIKVYPFYLFWLLTGLALFLLVILTLLLSLFVEVLRGAGSKQ